MKPVTASKLIISVSIGLVAFANMAFFTNLLDVYPPNLQNSLFLLSLAVLSICINIILLSLACFKYTIKPVLILIVLISSLSAYFMDSYQIIIDDLMIDNIINTDLNETLDLLSLKQVLYFVFLGVLPSIYIFRINIINLPIKAAILSRVILLLGSLVIAIALILTFSHAYTSFFRVHKSLRFYANPSYYLYSAGKYIDRLYKSKSVPLKRIGLDAQIPSSDVDRELIIFVVGETARADNFSLNGYSRKTNPYLEKEDVISFTNVSACGTSTSYSVPCIFSVYNRSNFSNAKADTTENVLDILQRAGTNVIWLDNNSNSKGVAERIPFEDYKSSANNPDCDFECRDIGMLANIQNYIDSHPEGDIFIILHQMGNHGPAYYKRYPAEFEKFTPVCKTNQLEECSTEEISNAYDNALLYTDYFLSQTIALLKMNNDKFEAAMFYVSDHGESLGEYNLYLHGLPYLIAPEEQTRVPLILWFGEKFDEEDVDLNYLRSRVDDEFSHDNIFHTILGFMEIETDVYDKNLDMTKLQSSPDE